MDFIGKIITKAAKKSPWILHLDTGGCNGCDIEIFTLLSAKYDVERFGVLDKGNPRQGDILIVTGAVSQKMAKRVKRIYMQMAHPKAVMAVGTCTMSCGIFAGSPVIKGPIWKIIPVDVFVQGCPPKPEEIINGLEKTIEIWASRFKAKKECLRVKDAVEVGSHEEK